MRETCLNCKHLYDLLFIEDKQFDKSCPKHIHNYCEVWKTTVNGQKGIDEILCLSNDGENNEILFDDLETGEAYCYRFNPKDKPFKPDEWFEHNLKHNEDVLLKLSKNCCE